MVCWFKTREDNPDELTGIWIVKSEYNDNGDRVIDIIPLNLIIQAYNLIGVYGDDLMAQDFHFSYSLDVFQSFYVNRFIDYHTHECLS